MNSRARVKKLPQNVLANAIPIKRYRTMSFNKNISPDCVSEDLGVRRANEACLEVFSGGKMIKNAYSSAIGALFLAGLIADIFIYNVIPGPYPREMWIAFFAAPMVAAAVGGLLYLITRNSQGGHVRISRKTGKIYCIIPGESHLVTLDWQEIHPMVAYLDIASGTAGSTVLNPLLLVGVDWTQSPPREASVSCGNLGLRDSGESARQLLSYIEHFMDYGLDGLPMPDPLPPPMSRKDTFLHGYRQWRKKFREDLSTPKGKRWAVLWAPAKVLWLITMVFPDSIGAYLDYSIPVVRFPEEIDAICGFESDGEA
ncbi:hypothetical protein N7650_03440 [Pseudomonas sp. GD04058]|uniref:hypothetical protein n=1 Tax=Pseudomonas sp. GD04058 TaxID=2975429 RepID=UPI002446EDE9|nr:hypothetical protein [Pseudomonas sp. GD04058]MDG9881883.1 hypothetical protein [Pseudomonas sp. GD04058]